MIGKRIYIRDCDFVGRKGDRKSSFINAFFKEELS